MGNLRSVEKALERVGAEAEITSDRARVEAADGVILPGVGAFPRAMERVRQLGLDELVAGRIEAGAPVLGICLGLQLLFESSVENEGGKRAGPARRRRRPARGQRLQGPAHRLVAGALGARPRASPRDSARRRPSTSSTHSHRGPATEGDVLGTAAYGERFACAVERPPLYGVQFHPEKSSSAGLRLLDNFVRICS